jgi:hypothetical protein
MTRLLRTLTVLATAAGVAAGTAACGTVGVHVYKNDPHYRADFAAAKLFNQRCGGCHTLSFAGTFGSGPNPRTYEAINGPSFNVRCERPAIRVLYAIENGGFSGAYMPQNVVVGKQARELALFVARYAGKQAVYQPGSSVPPCDKQAIGTLPSLASGQGTHFSPGNPTKPVSVDKGYDYKTGTVTSSSATAAPVSISAFASTTTKHRSSRARHPSGSARSHRRRSGTKRRAGHR